MRPAALFGPYLAARYVPANAVIVAALDKLQKAGALQVVDRPVAILDRVSAERYSTREVNATVCVVEADPGRLPDVQVRAVRQAARGEPAGLTNSDRHEPDEWGLVVAERGTGGGV